MTILFLMVLATLITTLAIAFLVVRYRSHRTGAVAEIREEYERLASESIAAQKELIEQVQRMDETIREVHRMLREV